MSESFVEEVDAEIIKQRGNNGLITFVALFRVTILLAVGVLVTVGLIANSVSQPAAFGFASVFALIWLRGKKST